MQVNDVFITKVALGITFPLATIFLFMIIWDLARASKAGRVGTLIMFIVLGGGYILFALKELTLWYLGK